MFVSWDFLEFWKLLVTFRYGMMDMIKKRTHEKSVVPFEKWQLVTHSSPPLVHSKHLNSFPLCAKNEKKSITISSIRNSNTNEKPSGYRSELML